MGAYVSLESCTVIRLGTASDRNSNKTQIGNMAYIFTDIKNIYNRSIVYYIGRKSESNCHCHESGKYKNAKYRVSTILWKP